VEISENRSLYVKLPLMLPTHKKLGSRSHQTLLGIPSILGDKESRNKKLMKNSVFNCKINNKHGIHRINMQKRRSSTTYIGISQ